MNKNLAITCIFGLIAIILGAFTTHGLQDVLNLKEMSSLETGIRYQMYHVIVLLIVNTSSLFSNKLKNSVSNVFFSGIVLFSGSIYAIYIFNYPVKSIWFVTPIGGLLFMIGWILMIYFFLKKVMIKKNK
jgi:uncharacterized membrane protein YgdD (TMEM256/DUF423 family)